MCKERTTHRKWCDPSGVHECFMERQVPMSDGTFRCAEGPVVGVGVLPTHSTQEEGRGGVTGVPRPMYRKLR